MMVHQCNSLERQQTWQQDIAFLTLEWFYLNFRNIDFRHWCNKELKEVLVQLRDWRVSILPSYNSQCHAYGCLIFCLLK